MKFVSLYSNRENVFPRMHFRDGLNVIFARVRDPLAKDRDSHNLGKTFLIQVIDFGLLGKITKEHPLKLHEQVFGEFVFFLELETNTGQYVTVRRQVAGARGINIHVHAERDQMLVDLPDSDWTFRSLGLDRAREELNQLLALEAIKPYNYRKGLGYLLRRQSDYADEFWISPFVRGKDRDWKPYLALILGFDYDLISHKYDLDERIEERTKYRELIEEEAGSQSEKYDEIAGVIEIREAAVERSRTELEQFSFRELESQINADLVSRIERQISELNETRYTLDYEIQEIEKSLESAFQFDIEKIREIFHEAQIVLPGSLMRSYEELVEFNRRLSSDRTHRLHSLREKLDVQRIEVENDIGRLDVERQIALAVLREQETLNKYRGLQRRVLQYEEEILDLHQQLIDLDRALAVQRGIEELEQERAAIINRIREGVRSTNETYRTIRRTFSRYVEDVLMVPALLSVTVNQQGNLDFKTQTIDRMMSDRETSESLGTSYKKILCACFDLAVTSAYASRSFYRFVYHDGVFEGLDNRKKVSLLGLIHRICQDKNIQYILTVIDSDLPRNEHDQKLLFSQEEVIRELHDEGDQGRLFQMPPF